MADLSIVKGENGDVHVGFDADGTFIPIHHVPAGRIRQLQERHADLAARAESDDPEEQKRVAEAVAGLPYSTSSKTGKGNSGTGKGGES